MSSAGRAVNSSGCVTKPKECGIGLRSCFVPIQSSSLTGSYVMATAEQREPYESRGSRTVVCPVKASMFSRRQTCRGKSQAPRSSDSRVAGKEQPTRPQSSGVQVPVPPIACRRAVSISDARGGNEPRSART